MVDTTDALAGGEDDREARGKKTLEPLLDEWRATVDKLDELQQWLVKAYEEVKTCKPIDQRWSTYREVESAAQKLDERLEQIEKHQEEALTAYLSTNGPVTLQLQDGTRRVLSATPQTAGGTADLLPKDLLAVWRVAAVFQGSVCTDGAAVTRLKFGDAAQIAATRPPKKARR